MPSVCAWHEAGHCVAAHVLGVPIKSATLDGVIVLRYNTPRARAYSAAVSLGGPAAESKALGYDAATIAKLSTSEAWSQDLANARRYVGEKGLKLTMRLARRIVHKNWHHVAAVAEALEARGTLDGAEIIELMSGNEAEPAETNLDAHGAP